MSIDANGIDPEVERVAGAIMNVFVKKWFLNPNYKGPNGQALPVYLDCVNGEMAWIEEAKAAIAAASSNAR